MIGNFLHGITIWVGSIRITDVNFVNNATLSITIPASNSSGYQNLTLVNPDGGYAVFVDVFFITDDCPEPGKEDSIIVNFILLGMYGVGLACRPCPAGATCPGGNRLWPLEGWYSK